MCEKINSENRIFIYLNHQTLLKEAYNANGNVNFKLRSELFNYRAKDDGIVQNMEKRKRKKNQKQIQKENPTESTIDVDLLLAWGSVKTKIASLTENMASEISEMPRIWEELQSNDFPKFKGANHTTSFQFIEDLVKGKRFLIPPNTCFYNYDVVDLENHISELVNFDLIILDPPWRNKYIRRLKKHNLGYKMLENENLQRLPIRNLIHTNSVVAVWCTNSKQHQEALINSLLPAWNLRILHRIRWLKINTLGELISTPSTNLEQKQPYEHLFIACHQNADTEFGLALKTVDFILSVPSIVHSHKPPLLSWLQSYFDSLNENPKCLEIFARYLQPNFTSFGLEVLKLMDFCLYEEI